MGQLEGRVALVTGASRGIGAAIAKRFGAEGAKVAITARTLDQHDHLEGSLQQTAKEIEALGGTAVPIVADLAEPSGLDAIVTQTQEALGPIDVLVNNAAAAFYLPFTKTSEKRFRVANDINFFAPWRLSQLVVPGMQERREGWILNISSVGGMMAMPTMSVYSASKLALEGASEALWYEVRPWNIHVSLIEPGFIQSDAFEKVRYTQLSQLSAGYEPDPYHQHYKHMSGFIARVMKRVPSSPQSVARTVVRARRRGAVPVELAMGPWERSHWGLLPPWETY